MSKMEVFNPLGKPEDELPVIYGFNNGGPPDFLQAVALADDGTYLGEHICSNEGFMPGDLGCYAGFRQDRHEDSYRPHYPAGYRMEFVRGEDVRSHAKLNEAFRLNQLQRPAEDSERAKEVK